MAYIINVSSDGPVTSIQEAVNQAVSYISTLTTAVEDVLIQVGRGTYAGFTIPDGALFPFLGTSFIFKISSAGNFFPIIDFNFTNEDFPIGIDIGSSNPNVVIESLRVQYFAVGIRALANSHEVKISKCLVLNNRNAGIFIEHLDSPQILQSVVVNGDYGIVSRLCKDSAIVHNTIFLNGSLTTEEGVAISALWAETAHDYGNGVLDTGKIYIIGNILYNSSGSNLTLFYDDVENSAIVSNYNDIVLSPGKQYINLEDRIFYRNSGSSIRRTFNSLSSWKSLGMDLSSISANPGFIKSIKTGSNRNVDGIDLTLINTSSVLGKVPAFYNDLTSTLLWLPSQVDSSDLSKDILGNNRNSSQSAIGANDQSSSAGFYGQDIFSSPLTLSQECKVDPILAVAGLKSQKWFPTISDGFFYKNDREFYLYSNKRCSYLGELAETEFKLPRNISLNKPMMLKVAGIEVGDEYFDVVANSLIVYHKDLSITTREEEIDFECYINNWTNDNQFIYSKAVHRFKIKDGKTRLFFPEDYDSTKAVVVTDDIAYPSDPIYSTNREYSTKLIDGRHELIFSNNSNLITNGQFDYTYSYAPLFWQSTGAIVTAPTSGTSPAYGQFVCRLSGTGYIEKVLPISSGAYALSFHARGTDLSYNLEFIDHNYNSMGYSLQSGFNCSDNWTRYYTILGANSNEFSGFITDPSYPVSFLGYKELPDDPSYILFRISHTGDSSLEIDGVQYEQGLSPTLYHRLPYLDELTVEYGITGNKSYIDYSQSISPTRTHISDGFIYIQEQAANQFGGPLDASITTLNEIKWPYGRKILPWSRTEGYDKLRFVPDCLFHDIPENILENIYPVDFISQPTNVYLTPSTPVCSQLDTNGIGISVQVTDQNNNPISNVGIACIISSSDDRFPGYLYKSKYGLKEQLGQNITTKLDSSGILSLIWIPPDNSFGKIVVDTPQPRFSFDYGEEISFIETKYEVSLESPNVTITNSDGSFINLEGSVLISDYFPAYTSDTSYVVLKYRPKYGSVIVYTEGIVLEESSTSDINSNQFYVDYETSKVIVKGRHDLITAEYIPLYYFVNKADPYKIYFYHTRVFGSYADKIVVGHDYKIDLQIQVEIPGYNSYIYRNFDMIAQNSMLTSSRFYNTIAIEI